MSEFAPENNQTILITSLDKVIHLKISLTSNINGCSCIHSIWSLDIFPSWCKRTPLPPWNPISTLWTESYVNSRPGAPYTYFMSFGFWIIRSIYSIHILALSQLMKVDPKSNISFFSVNIADRVLKTCPSSKFWKCLPMVPLVFFYDH